MVIITEQNVNLAGSGITLMGVALHDGDNCPQANKTKQTGKLLDGFHATASYKIN